MDIGYSQLNLLGTTNLLTPETENNIFNFPEQRGQQLNNSQEERLEENLLLFSNNEAINLDIDGNDKLEPSDYTLISLYASFGNDPNLFNVLLTNNADVLLGEGATRNTGDLLTNYLTSSQDTLFDLDGNGTVETSDYTLLGLYGSFGDDADLLNIFLQQNADVLLGEDAERTTGNQIIEHLAQFLPGVNQIENLTVMPGERLEIDLSTIFTENTTPTYLLSSEQTLPTGMLEANNRLVFNPNEQEIGSYQFTVTALEGQTETTKDFLLEVVADPVTTTRISGVIQNTDQDPLEGVVIELGNLQTVTNANGEFIIESPGELPSDTLKVRGETITGDVTYPFIAEKLPLLLERDPITGVNNVISRPIYLPPIDMANAVTIDPNVNTLVTTDNIPNASVFVAAGSIETPEGDLYTETLSITEVTRELTPAALPANLMPDLVVTIQPGEMVFNTPAPLSLPNLAGYEPGTEMDLWSINPETGLFDNVGTGRVNANGNVIETIDGGIRNSSWHFFAPPAGNPENADDNPRNQDQQCLECSAREAATSEVELHSGTVIETHDLVSYQSLGVNRGLSLTYDSQRADPRPIVHFGYSNITANANPRSVPRLMAELTIQQGDFEYQVAGGRNYWSVPTGNGPVDAALQADMRGLASGRYDYQLTTGLLQLNNNNAVNGSTSSQTGDIIHVNSIGSIFGNGWGLSGLVEIVENTDGSVLIIDGDGGELLFEALPEGGYDSPPGDFSVLEKLADGTFRRTMTDQMVYTFNADNKIAGISDRNGNTTEYLYNSQGNITTIIDPVGLQTTFTYANGLVTKITDPANRETVLEYDAAGNLTSITDPDGTSRTWEYDGDRHMTAETDKRGNYEQTFYDFAGRADRAILKDGSQLDFDPVQVQGLYQPNQTTNLFSAPSAFRLGAVESVYRDANGNIRRTLLDQAGQLVSASDEVGVLPSIERNEENLITRSIDGRGNTTDFEYDQRGNVIRVLDSVSIGNNIRTTGYFNLSDLNGGNGFIINGINENDGSGWSVSIAGDVNGDGIDDLLIGTFFDYYRSIADVSGESYVVFGSNNGFSANLDLSSLDGTNGFTIKNDMDGGPEWIVTSAGDINGDGIDDLIIGDPYGNGRRGKGYVIFGSRNGFNANFNVSSLDGTNGFIINGVDPDNNLQHFSGAGDINNDGIDDLIFGNNNEAYVILGSRNGFNATFDLSSFDGTNGFIINGDFGFNTSITSVSGAGDINNDGIDDLIIGNYDYDDPTYVIFGSSNGFSSNFNVSSLDGTNGFIINGTGNSSYDIVKNVGDVNGDDIDDLIIANDFKTYVIFGNSNGFSATFDLSSLDGTNGFMTRGTRVVSGAGDINEDGIDDLILGDDFVNANGVTLAGQTYVIFGSGNGFNANFDVFSLDGTNGFTINGIELFDLSGRSVSGGGDINGDGIDDLIIGALDADPGRSNDDPFGRNNAGQTYVIFGGSNPYQQYTYDPTFNQLTSYIDGLDHQTLYNIDPNNGNVLSITEVIGEVGGDDDLITQFTYTANGLVDTITDALGRVTDNDYDAFGRLISMTYAVGTNDEATQQFEYDTVGNQTAIIDENGNRTEFEYDALNRLISITEADPDGNGPLTSPITTYTYDADGNLLTTTDPESSIITNEYDVLNRLTKTTDSLNQITTFTYDSIGNLLSVVDPLGNETQNIYDDRYRLIQTIDPEEIITRFDYDLDNNLIEVNENASVIAADLLAFYPFEGNANDVSGNNKNGNVVGATLTEGYEGQAYQFDGINDYIRADININPSIHPQLTIGAWVKANGLNASNKNTIISHDNGDFDRTLTIDHRSGGLGWSAFSGSGQVVGFEPVDLGEWTFVAVVYNQSASTVTLYVDDQVFTELGTLGEGYNFIEIGRNPGFINELFTGVIDNLFIYDTALTTQEIAIIRQGGTNAIISSDELGLSNKTTFTYDSRNRLITETDPFNNTTTYEYDLVNNLIGQTDRNNRRIEYEYDDIDRLIQETWIDTDQVINYSYDAVSNLTSVVDQYSSLTYTYDNRDRLITADNLNTPNTPHVTLNYTYDNVGNMLSVIDTINGVEAGTNNYNYDALNRLIELAQFGNNVNDKSVNFAYNSLGQYTSISRYSDLVGTQLVNQTNYNYDDLNRLTNIGHNNGTNDVAFYNYGYDASSRITQITDVDGVTDYTYDDRDQLIGAERSNANFADETYQYDANGNRISSSLHENGYETGTANRLLSDGVYNYDYDNEGNLISKTEIATGNSQEFTWDYRNRLIVVIDKDSDGNELQRVEFVYDAFNRRISKTVDTTPLDEVAGVVTHFVYNGDDVHLEFVDNDGITGENEPILSQRYLHGAGVDQVLAQEDSNSNVIWMLTDHLGTIRDLVDENGILVNHLTYDSFGQVIAESDPSVETRYLFTGREFDEEIGLYYYRARYYDAEIGRFIGEDPIGFAGGDSNLYRYVLNSTVNLIDPNGLVPVAPIMFCAVQPEICAAIVVGGSMMAAGFVEAASHFWNTGGEWQGILPGQGPGRHHNRNEIYNNDCPPHRSQLDSAFNSLTYYQPTHCFYKFDYRATDGRQCIYDKKGDLVTENNCAGSYNIVAGGGAISSLGHACVDVLPWFFYGN
ncbi:RHS repeat-associated core domain-containing protein [Crocosphaera sp. XPORK-15E]|uniref:RHS repeat domain-containing protein n=1 Tax=Crocosphaera sp. XPORK-15E TaxID=3110247 RepID=UPI002B204F0F|nr:RHS repeat-associated core domain-containing protein [Crocosphaera sp. XPORK-15E]MEA5534957.1 RHS repeat-associated core domain-containing protein [Crocosphaera sp. XPORK-15E]